MKMVFLIYNVAIDNEVMQVLKACGIECYTKCPEVLGSGGHSGPHLGTHVWPGKNSAIAVGLEDEKATTLLAKIAELHEKMKKEGIRAFSWPIDNQV